MKQYKKFVALTIFQFFFILIIIAISIIIIDPYFHYHKPLKCLFYPLNNQRCQNNGITKHFDYEGIITGTSITENFKASEADKIFNARFIKIPYEGGSFKEINDNLLIAFKNSKSPKIIIRSLDCYDDYYYMIQDKNFMRSDLGTYPTYLYNNNLIDDVYYIFNKEIFFYEIIPLLKKSIIEKQKGFTDFDHYSYWMPNCSFGRTSVLNDKTEYKEPIKTNSLTQNEKLLIIENITQNITSLAKQQSQCTFYYFFPPYSAAWWGRKYEAGDIERQVEIEKTAIEEILKCENIKLFSFNNEFEITTNLNNYKDEGHYGEWINTLMLEYMAQDKCLLTKENYLSYLEKEKEFYSTFDYNSLFDQVDEEDRPCDLQ